MYAQLVSDPALLKELDLLKPKTHEKDRFTVLFYIKKPLLFGLVAAF